MSTERPILFSAPMVLALLAGTKTQTRLIVKGAPVRVTPFIGRDDKPTHEFGLHLTYDNVINQHVHCPYGQPGDRLWVKESIRRVGEPQGEECWCDSEFIADGAPTLADCWPWKNKALPPIHMPKGLSRISLDVAAVRVERLQDISEADAIAEGIERFGDGTFRNYLCKLQQPCEDDLCPSPDPRESYEALWESINGPGSWAANPWVWVVSFRVRP